MENPIRRKANHNEIPPGNLRKSKIFAGRVKTLPYTSGVRAALQTGILQHALFYTPWESPLICGRIRYGCGRKSKMQRLMFWCCNVSNSAVYAKEE